MKIIMIERKFEALFPSYPCASLKLRQIFLEWPALSSEKACNLWAIDISMACLATDPAFE